MAYDSQTGRGGQPTWGWNIYDDLTYDLVISIPSSHIHFKFEQAVKSLEKSFKKAVTVPKRIDVPDKFLWYVRRQCKRLIVKPLAFMEGEGVKPYASKVVGAWYDTTDFSDWILNMEIAGKYKPKEVHDGKPNKPK